MSQTGQNDEFMLFHQPVPKNHNYLQHAALCGTHTYAQHTKCTKTTIDVHLNSKMAAFIINSLFAYPWQSCRTSIINIAFAWTTTQYNFTEICIKDRYALLNGRTRVPGYKQIQVLFVYSELKSTKIQCNWSFTSYWMCIHTDTLSADIHQGK